MSRLTAIERRYFGQDSKVGKPVTPGLNFRVLQDLARRKGACSAVDGLGIHGMQSPRKRVRHNTQFWIDKQRCLEICSLLEKLSRRMRRVSCGT